MAGWTFQTSAADIEVNGTVPALALTEPAVITNISNGSHFSEVPIHILGTCPLDSYVSIYTNDFFRGSVLCSGAGDFEINSNLFPGQNSLSARAYNITDDEGPRSAPLDVFYDLPAIVNTTNNQAIVLPLTLSTNFKYKGVTVGQITELNLEINGGSSPYALNIDWGDGSQVVISQKEAGEVSVRHIYKKSGTATENSYVISINAADNNDTKAYLQLFVIVNPSKLGSLIATTIPTKPTFLQKRGSVMWAIYGAITLMAISFYLGERQELIILNRTMGR
jgi:hypothetical protein